MVAICFSLNLLNLFDNIDTYSNMDRQWSPQSQNSDNFSPIGTNSSMPPMQYGFDQQSSMDYLQQVQLQFAQEMQMQQQQQQHHLAPQRYGLFLGDLSSFCRDTDIREEFQVFGEIAEIRVKHGKDNAKALCYGFIEFTTLEAAMEAMKTMNGRLLKGRPLRIRWASSRSSSGVRHAPREQESQAPSIHVRFSSRDINRLVTEEDLRNVFSTFGDVADCTVKQSLIDQHTMLCHGYGFVAFADTPEGLRAAYMVVDAMRDATYDNVRYKCELSRKLQMKVSGFTPEPYQQQQQQPYPHHMQGGDVGYGYSPPTPTSGSAMPHAAAQHAVPASAIGKGQSREFHRALGSKFAGGYDPPYNPSQQQQQQQQQSRYSRPQSHYRPQSQPQPQPQHYASFPGGSASIPSSYQVFPPHPPYAQVGGSRPAMGTHFYSFPSRDRYGNASNIHQFRDTPSIPVIPVDAAALPHLAHVNVPASQRTYHQSAFGTTDGADARLSSPHAGPVKDYPAPDASGGLSLAIAMGGLSLNPVSSEEPYADREAACFFSKNFRSSARRDATMMDRSVTYGATSIAAAGIDSAGDSLVNLISCDSASPQRFNSLLPTDSGANYPRRMFASDLSVHSVVTEGDLYRSNSSEGKASVFYGVVASPVTTTCTTNTLSSPLISSNTSVSDALNTFTNSERTKEISIGAFESFTAVARTAAEVLEDDSDETFVQREQSHN